jgi:hypothetical protein
MFLLLVLALELGFALQAKVWFRSEVFEMLLDEFVRDTLDIQIDNSPLEHIVQDIEHMGKILEAVVEWVLEMGI